MLRTVQPTRYTLSRERAWKHKHDSHAHTQTWAKQRRKGAGERATKITRAQHALPSLSLTYSLTLSVNCALSSWRALLGSAQLGSSLVAAPGPILNVCTPRQYRYRSLRPRLRRRRRIAATLRIALKEHSRPLGSDWGSDTSFVFGFVLVFVSLSRLEKCRLIAITESKSERKNERKKSRATETTTSLTHIHTQRQTGAHTNKSRTENVCNTKIRWRVSAADVFQKPPSLLLSSYDFTVDGRLVIFPYAIPYAQIAGYCEGDKYLCRDL